MATPGKIVAVDGGKRGVLAGGKAAAFDADGQCAACCLSECPYCIDGISPAHLYFTFADIAQCEGPCFRALIDESYYAWCRWDGDPPATPGGTYASNAGGGCTYQATAAVSGTLKLYSDNAYGLADCVGDAEPYATRSIQFLLINGYFDGIYRRVYAYFYGSGGGPGEQARVGIFYYDEIPSPYPYDCFENWGGGNEGAACGASSGPAYEGGTVSVSASA